MAEGGKWEFEGEGMRSLNTTRSLSGAFADLCLQFDTYKGWRHISYYYPPPTYPTSTVQKLSQNIP